MNLEKKLITEFFVHCTPPTKLNQQKGVSIIGHRKLHFYTKPEVKAQEKYMIEKFTPFAPSVPLDCPVCVELTICYDHKGKKKNGYPKTTKPDSDNVFKSVGDAMEKSGFFVNDSRICDTRIVKIYNDKPGLYVKVYEILL